MTTENRLNELGVSLPTLPSPAGNYRHSVRTGNQLFLSGKGSPSTTGKVNSEVDVDRAYEAAREAGLILLAVLRDELGNLDKVRRIVKVNGMVNADVDFDRHPDVINGCSDLLVEVFGERGCHARTAVGAGSTPGQVSVVIELIVEVD